MQTRLTRILAFVLSIVLLLGIFPAGALAAGAEETAPVVRVTSNVTDETVKVVTTSPGVYGGQTGSFAYTSGKYLNIFAQNYVTVEGTTYNFAYYKINGKKYYKPSASKFNLDIDGFTGKVKLYNGNQTAVAFQNVGELTEDINIEFVYKIPGAYEEPVISVTSNISDKTVQVVTAPQAVNGGQTVTMSYDKANGLAIQAEPSVTVGGEEFLLDYYMVDGVKYLKANQERSYFVRDGGFYGDILIPEASKTGVTFKTNGSLSKDVAVEFVYRTEPGGDNLTKYTPVVTSDNTEYGTVLETVFQDNQGSGSVWKVTTKPKDDWYKLDYVTDGSTTKKYSSDGTTVEIPVTEDGQKFTAHFTAKVGSLYNETDAERVTINFTLSNDGMPLLGADGTVLANMDITIPYFDLANYNMQEYYRYGTEFGWGEYNDTKLIKRPTLLHAYIYILERFYLGLPEEKCGKGDAVSGLFSYNKRTKVMYMDSTQAYSSDDKGLKMALMITGSATSLYKKEYWGHDENLMYFVNHKYPYMSKGWGSTCDYILLSDGDRIDEAMFSDWNFYKEGGGFAAFEADAYTIDRGDTLTTSIMSTATVGVKEGESLPPALITNLDVAVYDENWNKVADLTGAGTYSYTFDTAGTYYIMGLDPNRKTTNARIAPCTTKVTVKHAPDKDENGVFQLTSAEDVAWFQNYVNTDKKTTAKAALTRDVDISGLSWTQAITNFAGEFDGQNHKLTVKLTKESLFTDLSGTVKNLTVAGSVNSYVYYVGSIASTVKGGALIDNCVNYATVTSTNSSGATGGLVGSVQQGIDKSVTISNCANYGKVEGRGSTGGIVGADYGYVATTVSGCVNKGEVNAGGYVGGIMGQCTEATKIRNCRNDGTITTATSGNTYAGGILGRTPYYTNLVEQCVNTGSVTAAYAGGIVGFNSGEIDSCYNTGAISGATAAGGITGVTQYVGVQNTHESNVGAVVSCYNLGTVTGTTAGGATGKLSGGTLMTRKFEVYVQEGTCQQLIGEKLNELNEDKTAFKTAQELKSTEMLTTLGENYKADAGNINNGYPVLSWQKSEGTAKPDIIYGDLTGDGKVQAVDAAMAYAIAQSKRVPTDEQFAAADVNGDEKVNAVDAAMIYAYARNKLEKFPAER